MSAVESLPYVLGIGAAIFVFSIVLSGPFERLQRRRGTYVEPKVSRRQSIGILAVCTFGGALVTFLILVLIESGSDAAKIAAFLVPFAYIAAVLAVCLRAARRHRERG